MSTPESIKLPISLLSISSEVLEQGAEEGDTEEVVSIGTEDDVAVEDGRLLGEVSGDA